MTRRVLLVDDDRAVREAMGQTLDLAGLVPILAGSYIEAKDHISADFAGVVVSDIRMPGKDGFALLDHARNIDPDLPVVLLTGEGDVPMAVRGMAGGAFDFLEKPCGPQEFLTVVQKALRTRALVLENRALKREIRRGDAPARTSVEVLISGPPGAGTAKIAEVIHLMSAAAMRPFLKLDVMRVRIPSLKERPEDIPVLFRHYVATACEQSDLPMPEVTAEVTSELMAQDWPGNARALMNAAMRFAMGLNETEADTAAPGLAGQMARVERSLLIEALQRYGGNATETAAALKLPRKTFYDKLSRHGIRAEDYRP